jgi:hypothetical protein
MFQRSTISTLAIQESTLGRSGPDGEAPSGNSVMSGGGVDSTKLLSLRCRCNKALLWLPFSCYMVAGKWPKSSTINTSIWSFHETRGSCRQTLIVIDPPYPFLHKKSENRRNWSPMCDVRAPASAHTSEALGRVEILSVSPRRGVILKR